MMAEVGTAINENKTMVMEAGKMVTQDETMMMKHEAMAMNAETMMMVGRYIVDRGRDYDDRGRDNDNRDREGIEILDKFNGVEKYDGYDEQVTFKEVTLPLLLQNLDGGHLLRSSRW